jgi:nucleotide-binding universal stress UspA family protein
VPENVEKAEIGADSSKGGNMLDKVLIATDGSDWSGKAVEFTIRLCGGTSCKVTLLTVAEEPVYPAVMDGMTPPIESMPPYEDIQEAIIAESQDLLERSEVPLKAAGIEVELKVRFGNPAREVLQEAEQGEYDMLIMGSHGRGALGKLVLGSVSYRVSHHVKCPLLIVH